MHDEIGRALIQLEPQDVAMQFPLSLLIRAREGGQILPTPQCFVFRRYDKLTARFYELFITCPKTKRRIF